MTRIRNVMILLVVSFVTMNVAAAEASWEFNDSVIDIAGHGPEGNVTKAGDVITYQIGITNNGTEDLTGIEARDYWGKKIWRSSWDSSNSKVLSPGETWVYTDKYVVTQFDIDESRDSNESFTDSIFLFCSQRSRLDMIRQPFVFKGNVSANSSEVVATGFMPKHDGFSFGNFYSGNCSEAEYYDIYGCYPNNSVNASVIYENLKENGGGCFGFCVGVWDFYANDIDAYDYSADSKMPYIRNGPLPIGCNNSSITVGDYIRNCQLLVFAKAVVVEKQKYASLDKKKTAIAGQYDYASSLAIYKELKARMASPAGWKENPAILGLHWEEEYYSFANTTVIVQEMDDPSKLYRLFGISAKKMCGHAVAPYRIEESSDHKFAKIAIYDSNYPRSSAFQYVYIDLENGKTSIDGYPYADIDRLEIISMDSVRKTPEVASFRDFAAGVQK